MRDPHYKSNVPKGTIVKISTSSQSEITGKVKNIVSPLEFHPLGIKVTLDDQNESQGRVIEVLEDTSSINKEILQKLSQDESIHLEFKASLLTPQETLEEIMQKYNIKNPKDAEKKLEHQIKEIIHSSMKTIAGFANTEGGDLFIGVKDRTGEILGLERDFEKVKGHDGDGFIIELKNQIKSHYNGTGIFSSIPIMEIIPVKGKEICHIHVSPSIEAYIMKEKLQINGQPLLIDKFYVRVTNSTEEFTPRDFYEKHWPLHQKKYLSSTQIIS